MVCGFAAGAVQSQSLLPYGFAAGAVQSQSLLPYGFAAGCEAGLRPAVP